MIRLLGPYKANEEGTCQGCTSQRDERGTRPDATVYIVDISKMTGNDTHGTSVRLCEVCLRELRGVIDSLELQP